MARQTAALDDTRTIPSSAIVRRRSHNIFIRAIPLYLILAIFLAWELLARTGIVAPVLMPPFTVAVQKFVELVVTGQLIEATVITLFRSVTGLVIAIGIGITVGLTMARVRSARWFFEPLIAIGLPMPTITLLPAFVIYFGTGDVSKIAIIALTCFFPIALASYSGAKHVNPKYVWSAQSLGTSRTGVIGRIILPGSLSYVFSGLRVAVPLAVIMAVLTEMIAGGGGLGYLLITAYQFLETPTAFAILLAILLFGFLIDRAIAGVRRLLLPWDD